MPHRGNSETQGKCCKQEPSFHCFKNALACTAEPSPLPLPMLRAASNGCACCERLSRQCSELEEEFAALRVCLQATDLLREEQFLAELHRRRFQKLLRDFPCPSEDLFRDVLRLCFRLRSKKRRNKVRAGCHARGVYAGHVAASGGSGPWSFETRLFPLRNRSKRRVAGGFPSLRSPFLKTQAAATMGCSSSKAVPAARADTRVEEEAPRVEPVVEATKTEPMEPTTPAAVETTDVEPEKEVKAEVTDVKRLDEEETTTLPRQPSELRSSL